MLRRIRAWWRTRRHPPTVRVVNDYPLDDPTLAGFAPWQYVQHTTDMLAYWLEDYR